MDCTFRYFESAKSRYNNFKRDKEIINEDEYNAFILLYLSFCSEDYKFRKDSIMKYSRYIKYI